MQRPAHLLLFVVLLSKKVWLWLEYFEAEAAGFVKYFFNSELGGAEKSLVFNVVNLVTFYLMMAYYGAPFGKKLFVL